MRKIYPNHDKKSILKLALIGLPANEKWGNLNNFNTEEYLRDTAHSTLEGTMGRLWIRFKVYDLYSCTDYKTWDH